MRTKIIAGNWKMYNDLAEANDFITFFIENLPDTNSEIIIAPSYTNLWHLFEATRDYPIEIVAQNMHQNAQGAYTGEVSAAMLKSIGIQRVILGHSERRAYFNETDELLHEKVSTALKHEMKVIFCVGESLNDRKEGKHFSVISSQLKNALFSLEASQWKSIVIAYEPVWAIGTGETASPQQAQEMHLHIRTEVEKNYGNAISQSVSILYGGSVKPDNAEEIFSQPDVDGGLVGGASLKIDSFIDIIKAMK